MNKERMKMKGPKEMKQYVARHRKHLKVVHWDDLAIFKLERCKNWFKRQKQLTKEELAELD